jgi:hypothetical protein
MVSLLVFDEQGFLGGVLVGDEFVAFDSCGDEDVVHGKEFGELLIVALDDGDFLWDDVLLDFDGLLDIMGL